jgi:transcriptional regulator with XRE-family HTH domain
MSENSLYNVGPVVAQALVLLRQERGYSRREAAARAGVTESAIHRWESNKREPSISSLYAMATTYEVPIGSFFPEQENISILKDKHDKKEKNSCS